MSQPMIVPEADALTWIADLARSRVVLFPQEAADGGLGFAPVEVGATLAFDGYRPTVLPPGKAFAPNKEVLFDFEHRADGSFEATPVCDHGPRVLAGVRPCDLKAIGLMDRVNRAGEPDPHYIARRDATVIIAYACAAPCDDRCFCDTVGALESRGGADVMLTPVDDVVLVEAHSEQGEALMATLDGTPCDEPEVLRARHVAARPAPFGRQLSSATDDTVGELAAALRSSWRSSLWREHSAACLSCGTCNLVCPTCYCFDTHDDVDIAAPGCGQRCRTWDACMLPEFAEVADGHNFRRDAAARQRHRVKRKFEYLSGHFDDTFCVGCGRCGTQCTVGIDIFDIARDLLASGSAE